MGFSGVNKDSHAMSMGHNNVSHLVHAMLCSDQGKIPEAGLGVCSRCTALQQMSRPCRQSIR